MPFVPSPLLAGLPLGSAGRRARRGFSMIEVILAIGILGVAVVALLGMIGPALDNVNTVQQINAGIACMSNLNTALNAAPFYDSNNISGSVYTWVQSSKYNYPTIIYFYNEVQNGDTQKPIIIPRQAIYCQNVNSKQPGYMLYTDMVTAIQNGAIDGPVIAMSLSVSPLAANFSSPLGNQAYAKANNPPNGSLFPVNNLPTNPNAQAGANGVAYYEGYLPILVQVFAVPLDQISLNPGGFQAWKALTETQRLFTYTTAVLRSNSN